MFRTLIIDNEQASVDRLSQLLSQNHASIKIAGTYLSAKGGLEGIKSLKPDLVFMDMLLQDASGFDLLKKTELPGFEFIVTTAHKNFALKAFKFNALDYLLKPIELHELDCALRKLQTKLRYQKLAGKLEVLSHKLDSLQNSSKKIMIATMEGFTMLSVHEIIHCQSEINYTKLLLAGKPPLLVSKTLKEFEKMLKAYNFFRVHNSHLINLSRVKGYTKGKGGYAILDDDSSVEVSTRRKAEFMKRLLQL